MKTSWMFVTALVVSSPLFAQKDTSRTYDPIVVTANKFEQKQSTTGKVITVINKQQLERSAGKTVAQILNEQAGIAISGALNNLGNPLSLFVRGAASGRALVLIDGIPMNDPSMINNEFDLNLMALDNIERVEICKGAQSTLYGSDAVAGVVNIITTSKDIKKPINLKANLSAGAYDTYKGNVQLFGKEKNFTYNARYAKLKSGGFSTANDKDGVGGFDRDGYHGDIANLNMQYQLNPFLAIKGFGQYSKYKVDVDAGLFNDSRDFTSDNENFLAGGGFVFKNAAVTLTGNYQYNDSKRILFDDSTDVPGSLIRNTNFGKTQFAELYADIDLIKGFSIVQGADFRHHTIHMNNFGTYRLSPSDPLQSYGSKTDSVASQASLYASLLYNGLSEKLNIELGGRLNVHSRYGSNYTYTFNPSYTINNRYRVFGSVGSSFKAPSLYQLYSEFGDPELKPETSVNYEVGFQQKFSFISNRVVYFYRRIKDGIDFRTLAWPTPSKYFNSYSQNVHGIEFETTINPTEKLSITANYTWQDIKESTQSRLDFSDKEYSYSLRRPKHSANMTIGYQLCEPFFVSLTGKYVSGRQDAGGYMVEDVYLPEYFIFGAYAEYKFSKAFKGYANAQNLTDKRFIEINGYNSIPFMLNGGVIITL